MVPPISDTTAATRNSMPGATTACTPWLAPIVSSPTAMKYPWIAVSNTVP